ncbi:hypothetical protein [Siphonobacter sp. SORGH_AS_0500]|uniref:hypothetical protein n=1 Tax=Siphonobacter sp. SORGH_AS_0500 TaxID=1864824 RepID=UPI00285B479C|nr:hypothetical protein [Siphonobacter sp. SORGH_AS_0500]MDR6194825.1 hypothetical protein [Siphonobacter sp. SORGH_AS_0500]
MNLRHKPSLWGLLFFLVGLLNSAQAQRTLELRSESISQLPHLYTIQDIVDERPNRSGIGSIILPSGQSSSLRFVGSLPTTFQRLLKQSPRQERDYPVRIRVKQFWFEERASSRMIRGTFRVQLAFEREIEGRYILLTECQAGSDYNRSAGMDGNYEIQIRQTLQRCLHEFGNWVKTHELKTEKLARRVQIRFKEYEPKGRLGDTVFYSPQRKLTWNDFRGPIRRVNPRTGALIYTSFGYEAMTKVENGTVFIDMTVKAFMLQNSSWTAEPATNMYALAHEQLHFDITHLITERFKKALLAEELPLEDYDSRIQYIFLESFREMNRYQELYDAETRHSINHAEQARWAEKVATELKEL